jgi:hypothetical protein
LKESGVVYTEIWIPLLYEVVPEHTRRVFQHTDINSDIGSILFDGGSTVALLWMEEFAQLAKASETPIRFLSNEPMLSI